MPASLLASIVCICGNCRNCREMHARVCKFRHCFEMDSVHRRNRSGETVQTNQLRQFTGQLCRGCCLLMRGCSVMRRNMSRLRCEKYFSCLADRSMHVTHCSRREPREWMNAQNRADEKCRSDFSLLRSTLAFTQPLCANYSCTRPAIAVRWSRG